MQRGSSNLRAVGKDQGKGMMDRVWAGICILGWAVGASATPAARETPPFEWAAYIEAARAAETIGDDEARCLAYPDLPGNSWRPDAGKWRCTILRKPLFQLDDVDRLLQTKQGRAELESAFAALLEAHYKDQTQRDQIFLALDVFDESARAGEVAKRWLERSPRNAFAHVALAAHHSAAGWKARGTRYVRKTSREQFDQMSKQFALAVPLYLKALEIEPRLSPACRNLAAIGRQSSDALQKYAMTTCTKVDPDSYFLALERIYAAQPKWGGSDEQLRHAVAYAEARVDRNPMLAALLGEAAGYRPANAGKLAEVADELAAAAKMGPSGALSGLAGRGYRHRGDRWSALGYLSQSLRFWPRNANRRYERAGVLRDLGELEWALSDMRVVLEEEPDDGWNHFRTGQIVANLTGEEDARPHFRKAMEFADVRQQAMAMYCQGYLLQEQLEQAGICTRDFVSEYPTDGEAWRQRFFYLESMDSEETEAAYDNFLRYADPDQPLHQQQAAELRQWRRQLQEQKGQAK